MECARKGSSPHDLSIDQQVTANILIQQLKDKPSIVKTTRCGYNKKGNNLPHWTSRLKKIWIDRAKRKNIKIFIIY